MQGLKGLKVGDVLQSLHFDYVHAIVDAATDVEDCWVWFLANPNSQGQYVKFGHVRVSPLDPLSWKRP